MNNGKKAAMITLSAIALVIGIIASVIISGIIHFVFSKQNISFKFFVIFIESCKRISENEQHRSMFFCFLGLFILLAALLLVSIRNPYQSSMNKVTPEIITPVPAGQNQYGSARWLPKKEIDKAFGSFVINPGNANIQRLIKAGIADSKIIESGRVPQTVDFKTIDSPIIKKGGIVLGMKKNGNKEKIYCLTADIHTLTIGTTRSGKTRTVVLQTVCALGFAGEGMIISDPKGEIYGYTSETLKRLGYEIITLDFKNPRKSSRYNFLQPVIDYIDANDIPKAAEATWDIVNSLVPRSKNGEPIWTNGEQAVIAAAALCVVYENRGEACRIYQNLTNVYYFIAYMCSTPDNGSAPIVQYAASLAPDHPAKALFAIADIAPEKTRGSFYTSALTTLRLFQSDNIYAMSCSSDFRLPELSKGKKVVYIILPDQKTTYYFPASLFVSQCYEQLVLAADSRGGRLERRVNFILDEVGNFTKIDNFAGKLTVGGGRGIRFNLFVQSIEQLTEKYGKETANIITANCQTWIYLKTDDVSTLKNISELLGNYTISSYSLSSQNARYTSPSSSHSVNFISRPLLTIEELKRIKRPYSLIMSHNRPVVLTAPDMSEWHFDKILGLKLYSKESCDLSACQDHCARVVLARENNRSDNYDGNRVNIALWGIWDFWGNQKRHIRSDPILKSINL